MSWLLGGRTSVDNGVLHCWHHHDLLHARECAISRDPAEDSWVVRARDGTELSRRLPRVGRLPLAG